MYGQLIPLQGYGAGKPIPLKKSYLLLGRDRDCDIILPIPTISSRHCELILTMGFWYVRDLKSLHGVKVDGIEVSKRKLLPDSTLTLGFHEYKIDYTPRARVTTSDCRKVLTDIQEILRLNPQFASAYYPGEVVSQSS